MSSSGSVRPDALDWPRVMAGFGLPAPEVEPQSVRRAWSNQLFRVQTNAGHFAVKRFDPASHAGINLEWLRLAVRFERLAIDAGVPAPEPVITPSDEALVAIDGEWFRAHHWVDSTPCPEAPTSAEVCAQIGDALGIVHGLTAPTSSDDTVNPWVSSAFPSPSPATALGWPGLTAELRRAAASGRTSPDWADRAAAVQPSIDRIVAWATETPPAPRVMSHGDLDPKNVLLTRTHQRATISIVDWDVAAPWPVSDELIRTATSFSGWDRPDLARTVIEAYARRRGLRPTVVVDQITPHAMVTDLLIGLDWAAGCLRRVSGLDEATPERRREASEQAIAELSALPTVVERVAALPQWLKG